jgi:hypothetical protein
VAPRLKEAVQWINQAADEHARKVRAEFFEAVDEVIEFLMSAETLTRKVAIPRCASTVF